MQIYINKDNQQLGPFDEDKVKEMLAKGEVSANDLAIREGESSWQKLGVLFQVNDAIFIPNSITTVSTTNLPKSQGKGCLSFLGIGMILLGIVIIFGGLVNYGLRQRNLNTYPCDLAAQEFKKADEMYEKMQKNKTPTAEEEWKSQRRVADRWSEACTARKDAGIFWRNVTIATTIVGVLSTLIGFLLFFIKRKPKMNN